MSHLLLLGAGFSRNWGGWLASEAFEYLLGCPEISRNPHLQAVLWRNQPTGGFENALAQIQASWKRDPANNQDHLVGLQNAVARMFNDMNKGYFNIVNFEFQQSKQMMVRTFLTKFNAIFTLNQDLLLERHYFNDMCLLSEGKWNTAELPGMNPLPDDENDLLNSNLWAQRKWMPVASTEFRVNPRSQPFFKLHGSSNWQESHGGPMLIMGGNKVNEIDHSPILSWYQQQFEEYLSHSDTRLMVIGYGFRDVHINQLIIRAVKNCGLRMFIIAPEGGDLARTVNPTHGAPIRSGTDLETIFESSLIGASRRPLREIFGNDMIEHSKVQRFFRDD